MCNSNLSVLPPQAPSMKRIHRDPSRWILHALEYAECSPYSFRYQPCLRLLKVIGKGKRKTASVLQRIAKHPPGFSVRSDKAHAPERLLSAAEQCGDFIDQRLCHARFAQNKSYLRGPGRQKKASAVLSQLVKDQLRMRAHVVQMLKPDFSAEGQHKGWLFRARQRVRVRAIAAFCLAYAQLYAFIYCILFPFFQKAMVSSMSSRLANRPSTSAVLMAKST